MRLRFAASRLALPLLVTSAPSIAAADTLFLKTEVVYGKILAEAGDSYSVQVSCKDKPVVISKSEVSQVFRNSQCGPAQWRIVIEDLKPTSVVGVYLWAGTADRKAFVFVDRNRDGKLDKDELASVIGARMPTTTYREF